MKIGYSFDDVLLVPRRSSIPSRFNGEIDLSTQLLCNLKLKYPLISANMDTVTEHKMANSMNKLGGLGIIHRFISNVGDHIAEINKIEGPAVACIGAGKEDIERFAEIHKRCPNVCAVLIDIAHGHSNALIDQIEILDFRWPNIPIIAGNVATYDGAWDLFEAGADCVKCGVGPGSLCSTRIQTGCGVPQLTAIMDTVNAAREYEKQNSKHVTIIADGGIKTSGDVIKALAGGADAVMIGNLFAGTEESPGEVYWDNGIMAKKYRGMASRAAQEDWKGKATSVEGESTVVPYKGLVKRVFEELINGMLSGMSYQNAVNLQELQKNVEFVAMTAAGIRESVPHGILR